MLDPEEKRQKQMQFELFFTKSVTRRDPTQSATIVLFLSAVFCQFIEPGGGYKRTDRRG